MTDYDYLPFKVERWTKGYGEPRRDDCDVRRSALSQGRIRGGSEAKAGRVHSAQAEGARHTEVDRRLAQEGGRPDATRSGLQMPGPNGNKYRHHCSLRQGRVAACDEIKAPVGLAGAPGRRNAFGPAGAAVDGRAGSDELAQSGHACA